MSQMKYAIFAFDTDATAFVHTQTYLSAMKLSFFIARSKVLSNRFLQLESARCSSSPCCHVMHRDRTGMRLPQPLVLGHGVWRAARLIGDEPFAVILPEDVIACQLGVLTQSMQAHRMIGGDMVAAMDVSPAEISS